MEKSLDGRNRRGALQSEVIATYVPQAEKLRHIPALDGVRTIAIAAVMLFHFFQNGPALSSSLLRAAGKVAMLGQTGVDLFFVLSGFLITGILLKMRGRPRALSTFYLRRTARIFPLYYAYLIGAFLLFPALHWTPRVAWADQWWFWVYAQNIQDTFVHNFHMFGPGHFWSLAVEEHFYLVWPFLVLLLPEKRLSRVLLATVGVAIATRAVLVWFGYPVFYFTLCRMDALAVGALLALLARRKESLHSMSKWLRRWGLLAGAAILPAYVLLTGTANPMVQIFKFTLVAMMCAAVLVLALTTQKESYAGRLLGSRPASVIAKGSYALYVFHPAIFEACQPFYARLPFAVCLGSAFAATGVAAFLSWHLIEAPCLRMRDRRPPRVEVPKTVSTSNVLEVPEAI